VRIEILPEAREDLIGGFRFYEHQAPGLGRYFRESRSVRQLVRRRIEFTSNRKAAEAFLRPGGFSNLTFYLLISY